MDCTNLYDPSVPCSNIAEGRILLLNRPGRISPDARYKIIKNIFFLYNVKPNYWFYIFAIVYVITVFTEVCKTSLL